MTRESISKILEAFGAVLEESGIHAALDFLNRRTPYRFTGIYRFDPPVLRCAHLFDRENPGLEVGADAPLRETYCSIVGESGRPFFTDDAGRDERLREHPGRAATGAYCGVLLGREGGPPFGTLCHFDLSPRPIPADEIPLLEAAAPLIVRRLEREKYFTSGSPR